MWHDPIVEEVRKVRDEYARRFNYDLAAIVREVQARQNASDEKVVDRSIGPRSRSRPFRATRKRRRRRSATRSLR
jgi:hypothetical protein